MSAPVGVVLAGGRGRRMGGAKAMAELGGRPLISYPVQALREALGCVAVAAKADTELPSLGGVAVWIEPEEPRHPLAGIVHALERAKGRPVLVCAADLPFVTAELARAIAETDAEGSAAVCSCREGVLQPLLGCYRPSARQPLAVALRAQDMRLIDAVGGLRPRRFEVADPDALFNVNSSRDLRLAAEMLASRT